MEPIEGLTMEMVRYIQGGYLIICAFYSVYVYRILVARNQQPQITAERHVTLSKNRPVLDQSIDRTLSHSPIKKVQLTPTEQSTEEINGLESENSRVRFTGLVGDYYKIWIVNTALTIITLGVYSAWATVRSRKYFYGHTLIGKDRFEYLGDPKQILKVRVLIMLLMLALGAYFLPEIFRTSDSEDHLFSLPFILLVVLFLGILGWPLLFILNIRTKARTTRFRNIRFDYNGTYLQALWVKSALPLIGLLSFQLALPAVIWKQNQFFYGKLLYGDKEWKTTFTIREFYFVCFVSFLITIVPSAVIFLAFALLDILLEALRKEEVTGYIRFGWALSFSILVSVYIPMIRSVILKGVEIEGIAKFTSKMKITQALWVIITNVIALFFSVGFAYPWTAIRYRRFLAESTEVFYLPGSSGVIDDLSKQPSYFAEGWDESGSDGFEV